MKYKYLSLMIGQLVLKQSISWQLMDDFVKELKESNNEEFYRLLGATTFYALKGIGGTMSINNMDIRKFCLGEISNACEDQIDDEELHLDSYDKSEEQEPNGTVLLNMENGKLLNVDESNLYIEEK